MKFNFEFQAVVSLATGLFLGMLSYGLLFTGIFIIMFEIFISLYSIKYPPADTVPIRVGLNVIFLIGWSLGRFLFLRETGFEGITNCCEEFWC